MMFRRLYEVFYFTPTLCGWDEYEDDDYVLTVAFAWLNWSVEFSFEVIHG